MIPADQFDYIECPACGEQAIQHQQLDPPEEQINCNKCGYFRKFHITNLKDKDQLSEFEWMPQYAIVEERGFGGYSLTLNHTGVQECGGFANSGSLDYFKSEVKRLGSEVTQAAYTQLIDGKLVETTLVNIPYPDSE